LAAGGSLFAGLLADAGVDGDGVSEAGVRCDTGGLGSGEEVASSNCENGVAAPFASAADAPGARVWLRTAWAAEPGSDATLGTGHLSGQFLTRLGCNRRANCPFDEKHCNYNVL